MARLLVYPALVAFAAWGALVELKTRGLLPPWATWTLVHGAPAGLYIMCVVVLAAIRYRLRYSLRSLIFFMMLSTCLWALYLDRAPWRNGKVLAFAVRSAALSPDGTRVVTVNSDMTTQVWDLRSGKQLTSLKGPKSGAPFALFSPDGKCIVTAGNDNTARVWDSSTGGELTVLKGHTDWVRSASFSPDGKHIVTASLDRTARVWDSSSGKELAVLTGHTSVVRSASFSPDGKRVLTASKDNTTRIWDSSSGRRLAELMIRETDPLLFPRPRPVYSASFSADGRRVLTTSRDGIARIWDSSSGKEVALFKGRMLDVYSASFSPDGGRIVTAGADYTGRVWDSTSGRQLAVLEGEVDWVCSASFSPDGKFIIMVSPGYTAKIWAASSGEVFAVLQGHIDKVRSASFSPDRKYIVTTSDDGTCRIWRRYRPEEWWGVFCMLEFWFSAVFAAALVWSLLADRRTFAKMDAEAARAKENRSRSEAPRGEAP